MKTVNGNVKRRKTKKMSLFRYRLRLVLKYFTIFCIVAAVGVTLSFTVFFKIENVEIEGSTRYTYEEIKECSNIKVNKNLFLLNKRKSKEEIEKHLPFVEVLSIERILPNRVIIRVKEAEKAVCYDLDDCYVFANKENRVIEIRGKSEDEVDFDNAVQIIGVKLKKADLGQNLIFSDNEISENLHQIFDTLEKNGLHEVSMVDMSDAKHVQAQYNKKIDIQLGTLEKLDYKIKTASEIINNKLSTESEGILDVSMLDQGNKSYFRPKDTI